MLPENIKYLIVGAGFWGAVLAERIATQLGEKVLLIDRRTHIGGNSYSEIHRASGIEVHSYGSHIFHTAHDDVRAYIQQFTSLNHYRHHVLAVYRGAQYNIPVNLDTINALYRKTFTPAQAKAFIEQEALSFQDQRDQDLEGRALSLVGKKLYTAFIKGYTFKQWGQDPGGLPASIIARLPVRFDHNADYFNDPCQGIPTGGYGAMFQRMLADPRITVRLGVDFDELRGALSPQTKVFYSGPIDRFFDFKYGPLGWRVVDFQDETLPIADFQGTTVVNYGEPKYPFTRIHEFKHYHPERPYSGLDRTVIFREYSRAARRDEIPCYPMNRAEDQRRLAEYQAMARQCPNVIFGGRLGEYKYYNMDQAIRSALSVFARLERDVRHGEVRT
jgi:UDP-galactopyranose mutase